MSKAQPAKRRNQTRGKPKRATQEKRRQRERASRHQLWVPVVVSGDLLAKALAITGQLPLDDGMSVGAADKDWLVDSVGREVIGAQLARIIDGWSREQMAKHELSGVGQISPLAWRIKIPS